MSCSEQIYVRLMDEGVVVWRPVFARRIAAGRFIIVDQAYDREVERWEFEPGDEVECEVVTPPGEQSFTAATRRL